MEANEVRNAERKMLGALKILYDAGFLVNRLGLAKVIRGEADGETSPVAYLSCFGYAPSLSRRTISLRLTHLLKKGMVEIRPAYKIDDAIFLTEEGEKRANTKITMSKSLFEKENKNIIRYKGEL